MELQIGEKVKWQSNGKECIGCYLEDKEGDPDTAIVISHRVGGRVWNQNMEIPKNQLELDI